MEESRRDVQSKQKSRKGKILFWIFIFLVISCGVWYALSIMNDPVVSEVRRIEMKYSLDTPNLPPSIKQFEGKYFSLYLPETYIEKRHETFENKEGALLEQTFFTQLSDPGRKVAITIEHADTNRADDLSSYAFRMMNPKIYKKDAYEWSGKSITIFLKNDPVYEIVGYIEKNDTVASLAVSSAIEPPLKLMSDFSDILKTFEWVDASGQIKK